jgi:hypothetical protein
MWDTLLEVAYRRRYGSTLRADGGWLYKPHGDAAHPEAVWLLPHESGFIPNSIIQRTQGLAAQHPRALLIVGYSESDEEVVSKLIHPLSERWRVIRIGPSATGELSITRPAKQALPLLMKELDCEPEVPGWEYINFANQHDLGQALAGRRLGPADVEACPRLPEVPSVKQQLSVTNSVVILADTTSAYSLGSLLNDLSHKTPKLCETICDNADPAVLAASLAGIKSSEAYSWGYLLGRLVVAGPDWLRQLRASLDVSALRSLVLYCSFQQISKRFLLATCVYVLRLQVND